MWSESVETPDSGKENNMVQVIQQLVNGSTKVNKGKNTKAGVAIHETANTTAGAGAHAHANLQSRGNVRQASWHFSVDDTAAYQSFNLDARCWHAGDGSGPGNNAHIAIEICVNEDGNYVQACKNAAELVRQLRDQGVGSDLKQHNAFSGKDCPNFMREGRDGVTWEVFQGWVANGTGSTPPPAVVDNPVTPPPAPAPSGLTVDGQWGEATTRRLQEYLGTPVDGVISHQWKSPQNENLFAAEWDRSQAGSTVIRALQGKIGVGQDGLFGARSIQALQRYLGTPQDGFISNPSTMVSELQRRLNANNL